MHRLTPTLAALLLLAFASGCGSTQTKTVVQMQTVTTTVTVTQPAKQPVKTATSTVTTAAPAPAASPSVPASGGAGVQTFSGNGSKNLADITVAKDSVVEWTNDGGLFQVFDSNLGIGINSQGHSGTSDLAAGTYTKVSVNAAGNWTIKIVPK
jgi:hypothetical protein